MGILDRLRGIFRRQEIKQQVRLFPAWQVNREQGRPSSYESFAKEGYGGNAIVYACIEAISNTAAEPELMALRMTRDGSEQALEAAHPLAHLLAQPNSYQSDFEFTEELLVHLSVAGNVYILKELTARGQVASLVLLRPDRVTIVPGDKTLVSHYIYSIDGARYKLDADEVIHLKHPNPINDLYGLSPIAVLAREIDVDNVATDFMKAFFDNAAVPFGVWKVKGKRLTEEEYEHITEMILRRFKGKTGYHKPLILDEDAEYQGIGATPQNMVFPDLRRISEVRIHAAFGVPPILTGSLTGLERASYANFESSLKAFWQDTMMPIYRRIEAGLTRGLRPHFGDDIVIRFDLSDVEVLQENQKVRWDRALKAYQAGLITRNEARLIVGMEAVEGGDELAPQALLPGLQGLPGGMKNLQPVPRSKTHELKALTCGHFEHKVFEFEDGTQMWDYLDWGNDMGKENLGNWEEKASDPRVRAGLEILEQVQQSSAKYAKAFEREIADCFTEIAERAANRVKGRRTSKGLPFGSADLIRGEDFESMRQVFAKYFGLVGKEVFGKVGEVIGVDLLKSLPDFETKQGERWRRFFLSQAAKRVRGIEESTRRMVANYLQVADDRGYSVWDIVNGVPDDNFPGLKSLVEETYQGRHETIARTELGVAANSAAVESYQESGVVNKVFVMDGIDFDLPCQNANGAEWSIAEARARPLEHPRCVRVFSPIVE